LYGESSNYSMLHFSVPILKRENCRLTHIEKAVKNTRI